MGWKIGKLFPLCLNVIVPESGSKEGRVPKILVELNLKKPLLRGTKIRMEGEIKWVDFTYEQLPLFCFYCGRIGHLERLCDKKLKDARAENVCEGQYGDWLRATVTKLGKRGAKEGQAGVGKESLGKEIVSRGVK